jgi:hypothetical protein
VVPALDFMERVTQCALKIFIRSYHRSIHVELDDGLRFTDSSNLPCKISRLEPLLGRIGRKLYDLKRFALVIQDRIVRSKNPDFTATLPIRLYSPD